MLTYYAANTVLDSMTGRRQNINLASSCFVGLSKTDPTRQATGLLEPPGTYSYTDPSTGLTTTVSTGYSRQQIGHYQTSATNKLEEANEGMTTNNDVIFFPEVLDVSSLPGGLTPEQIAHPWGELFYFCIFDAKTGGHLIAYAPITVWDPETQQYIETSINPAPEQLPIIRANQLTLTLY